MRVLSFFLLFFTLFWSCKNTSPGTTSGDSVPTDAKSLEVQVMAIHDEVMPRLNEIGHLSAQLRNIKSAVKESPEGKFESPDGLDQVLESLKLADQGMWDWMKAYSDTKSGLTEDQLKPFMEKQLVLIQKIKLDINASIEKAQAWIAAHPSK